MLQQSLFAIDFPQRRVRMRISTPKSTNPRRAPAKKGKYSPDQLELALDPRPGLLAALILNRRNKSVLTALLAASKDGTDCPVRLADLVRVTGYSDRTVKRAIGQLVRLDLILKLRSRIITYRIRWAEVRDFLSEQRAAQTCGLDNW